MAAASPSAAEPNRHIGSSFIDARASIITAVHTNYNNISRFTRPCLCVVYYNCKVAYSSEDASQRCPPVFLGDCSLQQQNRPRCRPGQGTRYMAAPLSVLLFFSVARMIFARSARAFAYFKMFLQPCKNMETRKTGDRLIGVAELCAQQNKVGCRPTVVAGDASHSQRERIVDT